MTNRVYAVTMNNSNDNCKAYTVSLEAVEATTFVSVELINSVCYFFCDRYAEQSHVSGNVARTVNVLVIQFRLLQWCEFVVLAVLQFMVAVSVGYQH